MRKAALFRLSKKSHFQKSCAKRIFPPVKKRRGRGAKPAPAAAEDESSPPKSAARPLRRGSSNGRRHTCCMPLAVFSIGCKRGGGFLKRKPPPLLPFLFCRPPSKTALWGRLREAGLYRRFSSMMKSSFLHVSTKPQRRKSLIAGLSGAMLS